MASPTCRMRFTNKQFACIMYLILIYALQIGSGITTSCGQNRWSLDTWLSVSAIYGFFYAFIMMLTLSEKSIGPCLYAICFVVNAISIIWQFILLGIPIGECWSALFEANYIISWTTLFPVIYLMWGVIGKSVDTAHEMQIPRNYGSNDDTHMVGAGVPNP